jgi:hypothetical protein
MSLAHAIRHVADHARSFGPGAAMHDLRQRAVNRVVPLQILRGMTVSVGDVPAELFDAGRYRARFATRDEVLAACGSDDAGMSREFAEDALDRGDRCFSLFDGARMVSFGWYAHKPTLITSGLLLHFDPAWVYMYRGYTLPAHRGQRLHGTGMALALREHARRGARGLITYVRSTNFASLRSVERMGYREFGELYLARVLGRVETWASPGCADHGFYVESVAAPSPLAAPLAAEVRS